MLKCLKIVGAWIVVHAVLWYVWRWVARQESAIQKAGRLLSPQELDDARAIGIGDPEDISVLVVDDVPVPGPRWMQDLGARFGFRPSGIAGMCLDRGIFLRKSSLGSRGILVHELVHTAQFARLGSKKAFLRNYLLECIIDGYAGASLEEEAVRVAAEVMMGRHRT
jgi:hypothetical protein